MRLKPESVVDARIMGLKTVFKSFRGLMYGSLCGSEEGLRKREAPFGVRRPDVVPDDRGVPSWEVSERASITQEDLLTKRTNS